MKSKPAKVLFIGFAHTALDPRLYYRQVKTLLDKQPDMECVYAGKTSLRGDLQSPASKYRIINLEKYRRSSGLLKGLGFLKACIAENPEWIQASDVKELIPAWMIRLCTGARIIYDAHEDYFNQAYEYSGKTAAGLLDAILRRCVEVLFVRTATAVFCTDRHLLQLYSRPMFHAKRVRLFRNFVQTSLVKETAAPPVPGEPFRIVYTGGVNEYRGVRESAEHVARYNKEHGDHALALDVYSPSNPLVMGLQEQGLVTHRGFLSHNEIFTVLPRYHMGICLLKKIKKYERNIPMKNFEYMAAGLPVLTSNFGNLQRYVRQAEAGLCIDPQDYGAFEKAVDTLRNPRQWSIVSENGKKATREIYSLGREIAPYLALFA